MSDGGFFDLKSMTWAARVTQDAYSSKAIRHLSEKIYLLFLVGCKNEKFLQLVSFLVSLVPIFLLDYKSTSYFSLSRRAKCNPPLH